MIDYEDDYYPDRDDDSLEAETYRNFADLRPPKLETEYFIAVTEGIIKDYIAAAAPRPPTEINDELKALQKFLRKKLSSDTKAILRAREHDRWQALRVSGRMYDGEWFERADRINDGGAALTMLREIATPDYKPAKKGRANAKRIFIARLATLYKHGGGIVEPKGSFVKYVMFASEEAGASVKDIPKAVRIFLKENDFDGCPEPARKHVYRVQNLPSKP